MDNADIGEPTGNVECPQTCSAFQNCGPSIRCNAPDRINDGYFNGLLILGWWVLGLLSESLLKTAMAKFLTTRWPDWKSNQRDSGLTVVVHASEGVRQLE